MNSAKNIKGDSPEVRRSLLVCRVSTKRQGTDDKWSLKEQEQEMRRVAKKLGLNVVDVIRVRHSGADAEAPHLKQISEAVAAKKIDVIQFHNVDRAFRSVYLGLKCFHEWTAAGATIYIGSWQLDLKDPDKEFHLVIQLALATHRHGQLNKAGRTRHVYASQGQWQRQTVPVGYTRDEGSRYLRRKPQLRSAVVQLFEIVASGGVRAAVGSTAAEYLGISKVDAVKELVKNPVYRGVNPYGEEEYPYESYRIVPDELWYVANAALPRRKKSSRSLDASLSEVAGEFGPTAVITSFLEQVRGVCRRCETEYGELNPVWLTEVRQAKRFEVPYLICPRNHKSPAVTHQALHDIADPLRICWGCGEYRKSRFETHQQERGSWRSGCRRCGWTTETGHFPFSNQPWRPDG